VGGERLLLRKRKAETELAEAERGAENSRLEILRQEARTNLIRRKEIDTGSLVDAAGNALPFSMVGDRAQARIDAEAQAILIRRMGRDDSPWSDVLNVSPLARESDLNRRMGRMDAAGRDPLRDATPRSDPDNARMREIAEEEHRAKKNAPGPVLNGKPADRFIYLPR
jgi:hypothetical protein